LATVALTEQNADMTKAGHPVVSNSPRSDNFRPHVVILGSGFGGLFAAKALNDRRVRVTLISRTTHHLFQPLLYQVATGILSEGEIAPATREVLRGQRNVQVLLGDVDAVDLNTRTVSWRLRQEEMCTHFDYLIVATGAEGSYFGNNGYGRFAPGMKSVDDALELRGRIFGAFELAEVTTDPAERERQLTFVVVGAGPTGVEMAGQIAELSRRTLKKDFRAINPREARVVLVDGAVEILPSFGESLGTKARAQLERMGVEVRVSTVVAHLDETGVTLRASDGAEEFVPSACKIWAAGVSANPLGQAIADQTGAAVDRAGRVMVEPDCSLPGDPHVFVVGDLMTLHNYPGVAQVAIQSARHVAKLILGEVKRGEAAPTTHEQSSERSERHPFVYKDKGSMATISRFSAVASIGRARFGGFVAWLLWLVIHLVYIIGFKRQLTTLIHWAVSFFGRGRSERTITRQQIAGRLALEELGHDFPRPSSSA
jgi:NADH:ubiquinone reductase (H+-translocating)